MFNIEALANNISKKVVSELNFDDDKREIIAYGAFALIQTFFSIALIIIFGNIFNVTIEAVIISFTISILRKASGGVHASSPGICTFLGTVIFVVLAILCKVSPVISLYKIALIGFGTFVLSYYIIYKLAPVDNKSKPIKKEKRRMLLKKRSFNILTIYVVIILCNLISYNFISDKRFLIYTLCIYSGVVWQVFTLTKFGHLILNKVDFFLNNIIKSIRRGI